MSCIYRKKHDIRRFSTIFGFWYPLGSWNKSPRNKGATTFTFYNPLGERETGENFPLPQPRTSLSGQSIGNLHQNHLIRATPLHTHTPHATTGATTGAASEADSCCKPGLGRAQGCSAPSSSLTLGGNVPSPHWSLRHKSFNPLPPGFSPHLLFYGFSRSLFSSLKSLFEGWWG